MTSKWHKLTFENWRQWRQQRHFDVKWRHLTSNVLTRQAWYNLTLMMFIDVLWRFLTFFWRISFFKKFKKNHMTFFDEFWRFLTRASNFITFNWRSPKKIISVKIHLICLYFIVDENIASMQRMYRWSWLFSLFKVHSFLELYFLKYWWIKTYSEGM